MEQIKQALIERLEKIGIEPYLIPAFIRNLANIILDDPHLTQFQVNMRLQLLGGDGSELDYHTYQLALAYFESDGFEGLEYIPVKWVEMNFKQFDGGVNRSSDRPNNLN